MNRPSIEGVVPYPDELVANYRANGYWEDRSIAAHFDAAVGEFSSTVAVIDEDRTVTYTELGLLVNRLASRFLEMGIGLSDRIIVQLPNCLEFAVVYFALQRMGAIPVLVLPSHRYAELAGIVRKSGAVGYIAAGHVGAFSYLELIRRLQQENAELKFNFSLPTRWISRFTTWQSCWIRKDWSTKPQPEQDCR